MPDLGPVGPNLWRFCLVPEGARHLWIRRHDTRRRKFEDLKTQYAGYVHTIALGDAVYDKPLKKNRRLLFRLCLRGGRPVLVHGKTHGPQPRTQVELTTMTHAAFAHAGLEPAANKKEDGA
jgi:hypothetical protein